MRILITTKSALRHQILLALLCRHFHGQIVGICIQSQKKEKSIKKPRRGSVIRKLSLAYLNRLKTLTGFSGATISRNRIELGYQRQLHSLYNYRPTDEWKIYGIEEHYDIDPNSKLSQSWVTKKKPDLIVVFGGKILKGTWLNTAKYGVLNMHYGILPAYRGGHSTEFALYQGNLDQIGASVHYVDRGIDTGTLISKHYVSPVGVTSLNTLLAKVYKAGLDGLINEVKQITEAKGQRAIQIKEPVQAGIPKSHHYGAKHFHKEIRLRAQQRLALINSVEWPHYSRLYDLCSKDYFSEFNGDKGASSKLKKSYCQFWCLA